MSSISEAIMDNARSIIWTGSSDFNVSKLRRVTQETLKNIQAASELKSVQPVTVRVKNPIRQLTEVPFIGSPIPELIAPDVTITKPSLTDEQIAEVIRDQERPIEIPAQVGIGQGDIKPDEMVIRPNPILDIPIDYGTNFTPEEQQEHTKEYQEITKETLGYTPVSIPDVNLPDITGFIGSLGEFGKYALLGLGALILVMVLKK